MLPFSPSFFSKATFSCAVYRGKPVKEAVFQLFSDVFFCQFAAHMGDRPGVCFGNCDVIFPGEFLAVYFFGDGVFAF